MPNQFPSRIAIIDVCDTLYYSNTTFGFINYVLQRQKKTSRLVLYKLLTTKTSPVFLVLALLQKLTHRDYIKNSSLKLLKGLSKKTLQTLAREFVNEVLSKLQIGETHILLTAFKAEGTPVILVSASLDIIIETVANQLQVAWKASSMDFDEHNFFTGNLSADLTGKKELALHEILNKETHEIILITDNFSDKALAQKADRNYIVVYNEKAKSFWEGLNAEFICLSKEQQS